MPVLPRLNVNCETKPVTLTRYIECRSYNMATRRNRRFIFCSAKLGIPGRNWVDKRTKKVEAYNSESSMVFTHLITGAWIRCLLWYQTYDYHLCSLDSGKKRPEYYRFWIKCDIQLAVSTPSHKTLLVADKNDRWYYCGMYYCHSTNYYCTVWYVPLWLDWVSRGSSNSGTEQCINTQ